MFRKLVSKVSFFHPSNFVLRSTQFLRVRRTQLVETGFWANTQLRMATNTPPAQNGKFDRWRWSQSPGYVLHPSHETKKHLKSATWIRMWPACSKHWNVPVSLWSRTAAFRHRCALPLLTREVASLFIRHNARSERRRKKTPMTVSGKDKLCCVAFPSSNVVKFTTVGQ